VQRGATRVVPLVGARAALEDQLARWQVRAPRYDRERPLALLVVRVEVVRPVRPLSGKHSHERADWVAGILCRRVELGARRSEGGAEALVWAHLVRAQAVPANDGWIGAVRQEVSANVRVNALRRKMQRRRAKPIGYVRVSARGEQQASHVKVAPQARDVQRGLVDHVCGVRRGARLEQA
jgi:hypothetical protein